MIKEISIAEVATFGSEPQKLTELSKFNFVFGSNGTGKTTISRVINDSDSHPNCNVVWQGGMKLETMVYNKDFVDRNFDPSTELQGVFTLGENQADVVRKLRETESRRSELLRTKENQQKELSGVDGQGGKNAELQELQKVIKNKCWKKMKAHQDIFQAAFKGLQNSQQRLWDKFEAERKTNTAALSTLDELQLAADSIFGQSPEHQQNIALIDPTLLLAHESNEVLATVVVGKHNVDISAMIERLGSGDWVLAGKRFYDVNDGYCPFCQQITSDTFAQNLIDYFDETYMEHIHAIDRITAHYGSDASNVQQQLEEIIESKSNFLDVENLANKKLQIDLLIRDNIQKLEIKRREPSRVVKLDSLHSTIDEINRQIQSANSRIDQHNRKVGNIDKERKTLISQIWRFLLNELESELESYDEKRLTLQGRINSLNSAIENTTTQIEQCNSQIAQLEMQTTSVQPTIDRINEILKSFGFNNFRVTKGSNEHTYQLLRPDGAKAQQTLSEGEKAFIAFLYFFHLLDGSKFNTGVVSARIVVFDDPVSSLDSNVLFVVSGLIREIMEDIRNDTGRIRQVFVLTHNVFFHREVTFNHKRSQSALSEETFWIVRKANDATRLTKYGANPIQTAYEMLWAEVFRSSERNNLTVQNNLRRILEYYFTLLGGIDRHKICSYFEGREKMICETLFSWTNSGSHSVNEDLFISVDDAVVEKYLEVFRKIFDNAGHKSHYKMMRESANRNNLAETQS